MPPQASFGWLLVCVGLAIVGLGLLWIFVPSLPWLGRLPGDIYVERERFRFYFPIVTCLLVSLLLSLLLWLVRLFTGRSG